MYHRVIFTVFISTILTAINPSFISWNSLTHVIPNLSESYGLFC